MLGIIAKRRRRRRDQSRVARAERGRQRALLLISASLLALAALWAWAARSGSWPDAFRRGSARGFNVLLVTLDTTRADHIGCYGYEPARTPSLDALADQGIRFDDAVTVVPVTLPSHASILTGLDPHRHGVRNNGEFHLDDEFVTLAEVLSGAAYQTSAFVAAFVLDARYGLDQGFDTYDADVGVDWSDRVDEFAPRIFERRAEPVTTNAVEWLGRRDRGRPFFCWVHYFDPHNPYQPPAPFDRQFADRPYDGEIAYMDHHVGALMQALKRENAWEDTVIVVVADHGEGLGDHDEATHAKLIYDSVMRVPLILACPSLIRRGVVVDDAVVSITDVFPTVLDALGIEVPAGLDGISLLSARAMEDRTIYMENLATYLDNGWSPLYGLRRHRDKFILAPRPEYYRVDRDPGELINLYTSAPGDARVQRDRLEGELRKLLSDIPGIEVVAAGAISPDAEAAEALRALGYAGFVAAPVDPDKLPDPKDMMTVMKALDRADAAARAGQYEAALDILKDAAAISPRDPRLLLTTGKVLTFMNRLADAETAYRACLSVRETARVSVLLAQLLLADQRLDEAEALLARAEELEPDFGGTFLARGDLYLNRRLPEEAIAAYERAAEVDPFRTSHEAGKRIERVHELLRLTSP